MTGTYHVFEYETFAGWAPVIGQWRLGETAEYLPPSEPELATGIVLAPGTITDGRLVCSVRFPSGGPEPLPQGRIVFGFDSASQAFYSAGLGGFNSLYLLEQFIPSQGIVPVRSGGNPINLERDTDYQLSVVLTGQWVSLAVNGVEVLETALPIPLQGTQFGLTAWGRSPVEFSDFSAMLGKPTAFVVMQFGEPYDTLYHDVIAPACDDMGYDAYRADDVFGPGVILNDIIDGIREAAVVIAEITPVNANVFYELGFAHATEKPTILLAERDQALPFDVQGFRCIFYDDTIGGKARVEADLRRHLTAIG